MADQDPHLQAEVGRPTGAYTIKFIDEQRREHIVEVDPARIPYGAHGLPGSILDIAMAYGIVLEHACGGVCACSTCHVIVRQGLESCSASTKYEEDQLDDAYALTARSRLACQCVPNGTQDLVIEIPAWNRNLARKSHG